MNDQTKEAFAKAKTMRPITVKAQGAQRSRRDVFILLISALRQGPAKRSDVLRALRGVTAAQLDEAIGALAADSMLVCRQTDERTPGRPATILSLSGRGMEMLLDVMDAMPPR